MLQRNAVHFSFSSSSDASPMLLSESITSAERSRHSKIASWMLSNRDETDCALAIALATNCPFNVGSAPFGMRPPPLPESLKQGLPLEKNLQVCYQARVKAVQERICRRCAQSPEGTGGRIYTRGHKQYNFPLWEAPQRKKRETPGKVA